MNNVKVIQYLSTNTVLMGITNPKNEPVRVIPVEDYRRYHQENFIQDGNFCTIEGDAVVASVHYQYDHFIINTTDNFQYAKPAQQ